MAKTGISVRFSLHEGLFSFSRRGMAFLLSDESGKSSTDGEKLWISKDEFYGRKFEITAEKNNSRI